MLLDADGHDVEVAVSGEDALARLKQGRSAEQPKPEVVLADMQLPGVSGCELAKALRTATGVGTILMAMSGSQPAKLALQGFDGFLLKPFGMEGLHAALSCAAEAATVVSTETVTGANKVPALNEDVYAKMAKMMPEAQLSEMYAMCLSDARKRLMQMKRLADAEDDEEFRKVAHTVKGGCGMIGASELYWLAEVAEQDGLANSSMKAVGTSGVTALLERFSGACDRLERILERRTNLVCASGEMNADENS